MKKIKGKVRGFIYNASPELLAMLFATIILGVVSMCEISVNPVAIFIACIGILAAVVVYLLWMKVTNKGLEYFKCTFSVLKPGCVWINMSPKKHKDGNHQKDFVKELPKLLEIIPEGSVCYCTTHEIIKKRIVKMFPDAEVTVAYEKELKKLKKKLGKEVTGEGKTTFYAIKFTKRVNKN